MDGADSEFRIKAVIDPSGAQAGGAQTEAQLQKIQEQTQLAQAWAEKLGISLDQARAALAALDAEANRDALQKVTTSIESARAAAQELGTPIDDVIDATGKMGQQAQEAGEAYESSTLRSRRNLTHLARGLVEVKEGGTAAFGGIATEAFLAGEAMDVAMGPIGIILLGLSVAIPILTRAWGEHKKAVDDNKESADSMKEAFEKAQKAISDAVDKATESIKAELAANAEFLDSYSKQESIDQGHLKALGEREAAVNRVTIATLELQKAEAMGAATTEEQRRAIAEEFKLKEQAVTASNALQKNDLEYQEASVAASEKFNEGNAAKQQFAINADLLRGFQDKADSTAAAATAAGFGPKDGKFDDSLRTANDADEQAKRAQNDALAAVQALQTKIDSLKLAQAAVEVRSPAQAAAMAPVIAANEHHLKTLERQLSEANAAQAAAGANLSLVKDALQAQENLTGEKSQGKDLSDAQAKLTDTINKLDAEYKDLLITVNNKKGGLTFADMGPDRQAIILDQQKQVDADQQSATQQKAKADYENANAELEGKRKVLEAQSDNPALNPEQKGDLKSQLDDLTVQIAQLKLANADALGLSTADRTGLGADITAGKLREHYDAQGGDTKEHAANLKQAADALHLIPAAELKEMGVKLANGAESVGQLLQDLLTIFQDQHTHTQGQVTALQNAIASLRGSGAS